MPDQVADADRREHNPINACHLVGQFLIRSVHKEPVAELVGRQLVRWLQRCRLPLILVVRLTADEA